ncbi:MAG: flagellar hook-length control protein FliK [Planctomycetota bacterium]
MHCRGRRRVLVTPFAITRFGRVEFDPTRVPQATWAEPRAAETFAQRLDARRRDDEVPAPAPTDAEPAAPAEPKAAPTNEDPTNPTARDLDQGAADADTGADSPAPTGTVAADTDLPSRAEPARRSKAEEGAGAALESQPQRAAAGASAALAAAVATAGVRRAGPAATAVAGVADVGAAATATAAARTGADRIGGHQLPVTQRQPAAPAAAPGFRTLTPHALQLDEQARDSVFKQILFKLGKDTSEMRLRLDPPELGEIDLHLVVEKGNTLRLSIATDRADLRELLQSGLGQLEKALRDSGLSVAHAEVHTRQQGRGDGGQDARNGGFAADARTNDSDAAPVAPPKAGWIAGTGLDFWV